MDVQMQIKELTLKGDLAGALNALFGCDPFGPGDTFAPTGHVDSMRAEAETPKVHAEAKQDGGCVLILRLDALDAAAVREAMRQRRAMAPLPEGGGNADGRVIAEIARGWAEMLHLPGVRRKGA